ncbi:MAG: hypothetical protein ACRD1A_07875, partial [Terriglobales bacterium]
VVALALAHLSVQDRTAREDLQNLRELSAARLYGLGAHVNFGALDIAGRPLEHAIPARARLLVIFVVRASSYRGDLIYWEQVVRIEPASAGLWFIGYCDGSRCNDETRRLGAPGVPLAAFGEVTGLEAVRSADRMDELLDLGQHAAVVASYRWRGEAPAVTAAFLRGVK